MKKEYLVSVFRSEPTSAVFDDLYAIVIVEANVKSRKLKEFKCASLSDAKKLFNIYKKSVAYSVNEAGDKSVVQYVELGELLTDTESGIIGRQLISREWPTKKQKVEWAEDEVNI